MKLLDLDKYLRKQGCLIVREGGNHTIYQNEALNKNVPVPRHREIKNSLVKKICKQLEVPSPFN